MYPKIHLMNQLCTVQSSYPPSQWYYSLRLLYMIEGRLPLLRSGQQRLVRSYQNPVDPMWHHQDLIQDLHQSCQLGTRQRYRSERGIAALTNGFIDAVGIA